MIRRRAPLKRSPLKRSRKPIPRKRATPRRGPLRDRGYLNFLATEGQCVACREHCIRHGYSGGCKACRDLSIGHCDPAHGPANGLGSKGPDNEALPLCREHHEYQTGIGVTKFGVLYRFNWLIEAATWYDAYQIYKRSLAR